MDLKPDPVGFAVVDVTVDNGWNQVPLVGSVCVGWFLATQLPVYGHPGVALDAKVHLVVGGFHDDGLDDSTRRLDRVSQTIERCLRGVSALFFGPGSEREEHLSFIGDVVVHLQVVFNPRVRLIEDDFVHRDVYSVAHSLPAYGGMGGLQAGRLADWLSLLGHWARCRLHRPQSIRPDLYHVRPFHGQTVT